MGRHTSHVCIRRLIKLKLALLRRYCKKNPHRKVRRAGKKSIYVEKKPISAVETISSVAEVATLGETASDGIKEAKVSKRGSRAQSKFGSGDMRSWARIDDCVEMPGIIEGTLGRF